ncbi:MAG: alpha/beta fold hydrolase [Pseudoxanthomonas sp.]|nr:alpha/beta fold hydrolase [Pseudoxanthomonas sp.]WDS38194.1 MAG: alpha/beta fold hydrolase [Pseudoxanthomonas sp.]
MSVRAFDHRGHGRSEGRRGVIAGAPQDLSRDVAQVFAAYAQEGRDLPFLLGHSLGGLAVMHMVAHAGLRPRGLVVSAPALAAHAGTFDRLLTRVFSRLAPDLAMGNGISADKLSHAPEVVRAYRDDPLNHDRISARLARYLFESGPQVVAAAGNWTVPTLLQVAGGDQVVDIAGARAFAAAAPVQVVRTVEYAGLFHELYNEAEPARSAVLADLAGWLQSRMDLDQAPDA